MVSAVEAREFAEKEGLDYLETSAKTGLNAEKCFVEMAGKVLRNIHADVYDLTNESCGIKTAQTVVKGTMQVQHHNKEANKKTGCAC